MKHLFLTAFMAIFGVYALGLAGILEMQPTNPQPEKTAAQPLSFTERIAANDQTPHRHIQRSSERYTLKALR